MPKGQSKPGKKALMKVTDVGHSTMLIELAGLKILTDPWFTDPILGIVTHSREIGMSIDELPEIDLILISHSHFDHCDMKALARLNRSAVVIVPESKTATRIRRLGYSDVSVLSPWEARKVSTLRVTALPADHLAPECTYVISGDERALFFGGDTRYMRDLREIGEKFDITVALLPMNGLSFPFVGKLVMDPADAAEAAIQLKTRTVIPIHYNISLTIPLLRQLFERGAPGSPKQLAAELKKRNRHVRMVALSPGESWVCEQ
ncbi:MBL fold metallo-hydrolase [Candidatus Poribacteria bacterium]|nr:MBL fold metallo-hydrolase [Candidatus Poribacteria bacterium]